MEGSLTADYVQKTLIPVQFGKGINTKIDPKQLQAGELLTLNNGQFSKAGMINKRFGYDILNNTIEGGGFITNGVELSNYEEELILFDGNNLFSYLPSTGNWSNRGTAISITTEDKDIIRKSDAQQLNPDMAYLNGIEVFAWEDSRTGVRYSVMDTATRAFAISDALMNPQGQQPKCIAFQNLILVFYTDGQNTLFYQTINPRNPTAITPYVQIATDGLNGNNGFPYDVSIIGNQLFVGYLSASPITGSIKLFYLDAQFNKSSASTIENLPNRTITGGAHGCISVVGDSSLNCWISWATGTGIRVARNTYSNNADLSSTQFDIGNVRAITSIANPSGGLLLFMENYNVVASNTFIEYGIVNNDGTSGSNLQQIRSVGLASKPWLLNNNIYINAAYESKLQSSDFTFIIVQNNKIIATPTIIAKETPGIGGGLITNGMVPEMATLSSGVFKFANLQSGKVISEANTLFSLLGVNSTKLTFQPSNNFINTVQANTLLIVGGILQGYDGISTTELGFNIYPEDVVAAPSGHLANLSEGVYQYQVVFEWTDNNGQIYRSAPSVPISVQTLVNNQVALSGPSLRLTSKQNVSIVIYRTAANGTTFNRITSTIQPLLNDPTTNSWSFIDTLSDTLASSNELLYTTGNILENISPPANSIITTYNNRVFLAGLSDKLLMWYSQSVVDNSNFNTIPPQFCEQLTVACDPRGGNITALGLLNQTLIIFKEREIFSLQGNGPDATGNNNDFADPTLVTSDVGCINANSIVIIPEGLMFQSHKGIYLLDQSLNVSYIGAPIEDFTTNITSAIENPQDNQIILTTSNGTALVYDYYFKQWATWSNHPASDSAIYNNTFCFLTPQGKVYTQNRSKYTDGASPIYLSWTLPNLSFAGLNGFQRVYKAYILGTYKGPHTLNIQVAYDYNDSYTQNVIVNASSNVSNWGSDANWGSSHFWGGEYQIYEFRVDFNIQKCTSIRISVSDNQASAYNEGYSISSVVFEVGVLPGGNRLAISNTYGTK